MAHEQTKKEIQDSLEQIHDQDGEPITVMRFKSVPFPNIPTLPGAMSQLHVLPAHEDDIFICAYPCCGTHWIWEVTSMLLNEKAERIQVAKGEFMLELAPSEKFADKSPPRPFNTHVQPQFLPETVLSQNKIILVVRNPKDVVVSYYRLNLGLVKEYNGTFPSFFEMFLGKNGECGNIPYGDYFDYLNKWWQAIKDKPNCLIVSYEEASQDLQKTVNKIGEFLGKPPSPELAAGIADLCTFDKMKKEKVASSDKKDEANWKQGYSFYRKGKVATWKEWLTVSQNERLDDHVKKELADCGIPIVYSI